MLRHKHPSHAPPKAAGLSPRKRTWTKSWAYGRLERECRFPFCQSQSESIFFSCVARRVWCLMCRDRVAMIDVLKLPLLIGCAIYRFYM